MSRPAVRALHGLVLAGAVAWVPPLFAAEPAPALATWDGRHPIARIEATVVYFVPADRTALVDWRARAEWFARRIEAFHAREFEGTSTLVARVEELPLVSRQSTAALREGNADAIFFRTLREADERLSFAREARGAFPVLVVLSDINWRPLDDFHRLAPRGTGWEFEGALSPDGIHVPGAASGGARATYLADAGKGWGLVSADGWRVPYRGSDCVVYHEGVGHAIGLPHPQQPTADVMSQGQYRVTLGQSWVDDAQKRTLGWRPVAGFDAAAHALFSGFTAAPEPAVPRPGQSVALRLGFPDGLAVTLPVVEIQTSLRGPWTSVAVPATALTDGLVPLGRFDRPCPVAWRARVRRAVARGAADDDAELWGYFQVRSAPDTPPPPAEVDPLDRSVPVATADTAPVDLLAAIDPARDAVSGIWSLEPAAAGAGARLTAPRQFGARLELPTVPPAEYRLTVIAEPLDDPDGLILGQRAGDARFVVLLGFTPAGEQLGALENVAGGNVAAPANPTRFAAEVFARGRPATVVVTVSAAGVQVDVDGRTRIDWRGDPATLSLSDYWATPQAERLFLGAYDCRWRFHRVSLEAIGGAEKP